MQSTTNSANRTELFPNDYSIVEHYENSRIGAQTTLKHNLSNAEVRHGIGAGGDEYCLPSF